MAGRRGRRKAAIERADPIAYDGDNEWSLGCLPIIGNVDAALAQLQSDVPEGRENVDIDTHSRGTAGAAAVGRLDIAALVVLWLEHSLLGRRRAC